MMFNLFKSKKKPLPVTHHGYYIKPFKTQENDIKLNFIDLPIPSARLHTSAREYILEHKLLGKRLLITNYKQQGSVIEFALVKYDDNTCDYKDELYNTIQFCGTQLSSLFGGIPLYISVTIS